MRATHGVGPIHRHIGSMGNCSDPGRVFKGTKLPGHFGVERTTVQNLEVVKIDAENNLIAIKGAIPGPKGAIVSVMAAVKKQKVKNTSVSISKNPQKASARK
ncbi:MAG: 50S ribosomal protein L3, partial [Oscillospiraceae bacterium]|nr:50S ribosomal protein L3 [Oscillospiraceae bacterium]